MVSLGLLLKYSWTTIRKIVYLWPTFSKLKWVNSRQGGLNHTQDTAQRYQHTRNHQINHYRRNKCSKVMEKGRIDMEKQINQKNDRSLQFFRGWELYSGDSFIESQQACHQLRSKTTDWRYRYREKLLACGVLKRSMAF